MLQPLERFQELDVYARDGEAGRVSDLYVDHERWVVRYLVVGTGGWLGRQVLISPVSAEAPDWQQGRLYLNLTREQVRDSPDVLTLGPLTRSREAQHAAYYGYTAYWGGPGLWGWAGYPGALAGPPPPGYAAADEPEPSDVPLRLASDLRGLHLHARDGEVGHIDDALVDAVGWDARYLLVDTSNWIGGRAVLIPITIVAGTPWTDGVVRITASRSTVRTAPEFDAGAVGAGPVGADAEADLERHYRSAAPPPAAGAARARAAGVDGIGRQERDTEIASRDAR